MPGVASVGSAADGGGLAGMPLEQGRAQWGWGGLVFFCHFVFIYKLEMISECITFGKANCDSASVCLMAVVSRAVLHLGSPSRARRSCPSSYTEMLPLPARASCMRPST